MKKITLIFLSLLIISLVQAQEFECGNDVTFTYRGVSVTYGTVEGENGTCWLDRNLGASRVAIAFDDSEAYGDLFQWGRLDDGHQDRSSGKTNILSDTDIPGHDDFITNHDYPYDWRSPQNNGFWQYPDYINNPCPVNWRVPTEIELINEMESWNSIDIEGAFNSTLKFTASGYHSPNGTNVNLGTAGYFWSSDIDGIRARRLTISEDNTSINNTLRVNGLSVRCIKIYEFAGGDGTELNPFEIETAEHLNNVRNYLGDEHSNKHFKLIKDIDLGEFLSEGSHGYNGGAFWEPIGDINNWFMGKFNGNDKIINNLKINRPDETNVGLFGCAGPDGNINNLGVEIAEGHTIEGHINVGAIVGYNNQSLISNSYAGGSVSGRSTVGGLVGMNLLGIIQECFYNGEVIATNIGRLGGLVGFNTGTIINSNSSGSVSGTSINNEMGGLVGRSSGTIENSYSTSSVSGGGQHIGGLIGYATNTIIFKSYATGNVTGNTDVGGLIGTNINSKVIHCYSTGKPTGNLNIGGLVGSIDDGANFEDTGNFWDTENSQIETSAMGTGKLTAEMKTNATFTAGVGDEVWDFEQVWDIKEGIIISYPYLIQNEQIPAPGSESPHFAGGNGTEGNPFEIETPEHLDNLRLCLGEEHNDKHFILMNDIDLSEYLSEGNPGYNEGAFWMPIGNSANRFEGTLNGNGEKISSLKIDRSNSDYIGLFGFIGEDGNIENLGVEIDGELEGRNDVGGLAGENRGNINACYVYGSVLGVERVGGLVGINSDGVISNCFAEGTVIGPDVVGGLIGENNRGIVSNSHFSGLVEGESDVGGLVGENYGSINSCYSNGVVKGSHSVGGFAGYMGDGTINNSYSLSNVIRSSGTQIDCGGFIGYIGNVGTTITNCYSTGSVYDNTTTTYLTDKGFLGHTYESVLSGNFWNTQTSGATSSACNATGLTTAEMKMQVAFAGWDFEGVWSIINGEGEVSYPYLADNQEDPAPGLADGYIVAFSSNEYGILSAEIGTTAFASGMLIEENAEVVFTATPDPDYMVEWNVNNVTLPVYPLTYTIQNLDDDTEVIATFSPIVVEWPTLSNITYGQPLSESYFSSANTNLDGEFEHLTPDILINAGNFIAWISFTPNDTENYSPILNPRDIEVAQKELTIGGTFTAQDKTYDRTDVAVLNDNNLVLEGIVGDDDVSLTGINLSFATPNANTGILVSLSSADLTGDNASNYTLSLTGAPTTTADINTKELTVTDVSVAAKVYDGNTEAPLEGATLKPDDLLPGDDATLTNHTLGTFAQAGIGNGIAVSTSMTLTGAQAGNYSLVQPVGLTADIEARPLTITPNNIFKPFGDEYVFDGTEITTDNLVGNDEVASVTLTSDGAAENALLGDYDIVITPGSEDGAGLENYTISYVVGTLSVRRDISITGLTAASRVYDGTATATVTNWGTLEGVTPDDDVSIDNSAATATFDSKNAGTSKDVTVTDIALSGDDAGLYMLLPATVVAKADITARELTLTDVGVDDKVYDGTTTATVTATLAGAIAGDDVEPGVLVGAFASKDVGEGIAVTPTMTLTGDDAGNYTLTQPTGLAAGITALGLTIGGSLTAEDKEHNGTTVATIDASGLSLLTPIPGDAVSLVSVEAQFDNAEVGEGKTVSIKAAALAGADMGNYTLSLAGAPTATASITEAFVAPETHTLTLTASPAEGGTVSGARDYEADEQVEVTATPAEGYAFVSWALGDSVVSTTAGFTYTMPDSAVTLTANFEEVPVTPEQYTLTLTVVGNGSVTVNGAAYTAPVTVNEGATLELDAIPAAGWKFDGWSGDLTSPNTDQSIGLGSDMAITATFSPVSSTNTLSLADVVAYPNPFRSTLTLSGTQGVSRMVVTSILGSQVMDLDLNGQEQVTLYTGELVRGMYLINLYSINGERVVRRVMKE